MLEIDGRGNDFDLHANIKVDFQFFNPPHLTNGGREKHLWMLGVWSISSVSRLWRLYRLFHQRASVPIEFTAIVCQALHLWFSPQARFAFYLFWRFSRRQQKFDLGHERKSLIRSRCQWVWPCHTEKIRLRWKQSLDELIETSDVEDFFSNLVDRLTPLGHSEGRI